jgi:hypothetical protein
MRIFSTIFFLLILTKAETQQTLIVPEFKNVNPKDNYPSNTFLSLYANQFDIVISLKGFSAWGPDYHIKMLAHHQSGWYKIEINTDEKTLNPYTVCLSTIKINDSIGNILWDTLTQNHLFEMKDERGNEIEFCPPIIEDTIVADNGKKQIIFRGTSGSDMPEYEFELVTSKNYKKLYFYSPFEKSGYCSKTNELKWVVNCINIFKKYLGE